MTSAQDRPPPPSAPAPRAPHPDTGGALPHVPPPHAPLPGGGGTARQTVHAVSGFAYGAVGADVHVFGDGAPVYLLRAHRASPVRRDSAWLREQPSRLLGASAGIVPFTGREAELAELTDWRDCGARLAVRWLYGEGGQGKTRLADRLAALSERAGWLVVDAVPAGDVHPPAEGGQDLRGAEGVRGVLLLVDQADRRPAPHLGWLFRNGLLDRPVPVRVLLTARSADAWPTLRAALARLGRPAFTSEQALAALPGGVEGRSAMFRAARDAFARHYPGLRDPDGIPPPIGLAAPCFGLTLAVHSAALVAVDARAHGRETPADPVGLTAYLLDREAENWSRQHGRRTPHDGAGSARTSSTASTTNTTIARTVFTAVLTGPLRPARAERLLSELLLRDPAGALAAHAACYPPPDADDANALHPLLPDRLAEDFLALSLPGSPLTGRPTDLWTVTAVHTVLRRDGGNAPPCTARALSLLAAAAERWPHVGERALFPLLRRDPSLVVDAGGAVLSSLAAIEHQDPEAVRSVGEALPVRPDLGLDAGAADFGERLTDFLGPADVAAPGAPAVRHAGTGRLDDALASARTTVARLRELSGETTRAGAEPAVRTAPGADRTDRDRGGPRRDDRRRPDASGPNAPEPAPSSAPTPHRPGDLADALLREGVLLIALGRPADAVPVCEEAVRRCRELCREERSRRAARKGPGALAEWARREDRDRRLSLAAALAGLGRALHADGRVRQALEATEEAVGLYAATPPPAALSAFLDTESQRASLLVGRAEMLADTGLHGRALELAEESVRGFREVAELAPHVYGRDLAAALARLSGLLWRLGMGARARAAAEEAAALCRTAAEARPERRLQLVMRLWQLGGLLRDMELPEAAEKVLAEAVLRIPELPLPGPDARLDDLTSALSGLRSLRPPPEAVWRPAAEIDRAARRLARARDWPALWALVLSLPVPHAVRTARLLPRGPLLGPREGRPGPPETDGPLRSGLPRPRPSTATPPPPNPVAGRAPGALRHPSGLPDRSASPAGLRPPEETPPRDGLVSRFAGPTWQPPGAAGRALARRLVTHRPRATARTAEELAHGAYLRTEDAVAHPRQASFAPGRPLLALVTATPSSGAGPEGERVEVLDLGTGRRQGLHRGREEHSAFACLATGAVAAIRTSRAGGTELVRYENGGARRLVSGDPLRGGEVVATADGFVVGLRSEPCALLGGAGGRAVRGCEAHEVREVGLGAFGLDRGDLLAVDPSGRRLALSDGARLVVTDSAMAAPVADAVVPDGHGALLELAFSGPDELVTLGTGGVLCVWQTVGRRLLTAARSERPVRLCHLFAVPAWRAIGGWSTESARPVFFDATTLAPREVSLPAPPGGGFLPGVTASADGRRLLYGRRGLTPSKKPAHWTETTVLDLTHPGAVLQRPLAVLGLAEIDGALNAPGLPSEGRELLMLARAAVTHRLDVRDGLCP